MTEHTEREIQKLTGQLTESQQIKAQINAVINLLVDKNLVQSEDYFREYIESLKEVIELAENKKTL